MTSYLGYKSEWLEENNAIHTAKEICQQPEIWRELSEILSRNSNDLDAFLSPLFEQKELRIILTGAGTSAFVGDAAAPFMQAAHNFNVQSIPTTDIVSNPELYLDPGRPTLLVSFARSGNSPESVAAVELVDQLVTKSYHLFLTCNPDGELAKFAQANEKACCVLMPEKANDKSFAMTSSFSCMLMSTLALFTGLSVKSRQECIEQIADLCEKGIRIWQEPIKKLAQLDYKRLIVLGSGGFAGLAREASLKSLELSAGQVMTTFDSSLGFRHGPKFTINSEALVIQLLSSVEHTRRYDMDLYNEINRDQQALHHLALSELPVPGDNDFQLEQINLGDAWLCFPYIVFCQLLGCEKSIQLGLGPDNPCPSGEVNRVVQGVNIYPYEHQFTI